MDTETHHNRDGATIGAFQRLDSSLAARHPHLDENDRRVVTSRIMEFIAEGMEKGANPGLFKFAEDNSIDIREMGVLKRSDEGFRSEGIVLAEAFLPNQDINDILENHNRS